MQPTISNKTQPKCQKCKRNILRGRRLCASCRKHDATTSARVAPAPIWARVLAVKSAPTASANFYAPRLVTTADILALRNESLLSASPEAFEVAADLAAQWNKFLAVAQ